MTRISLPGGMLPQQPTPPAAATNAAYQALQAYSSATTAQPPSPSATDKSRAALIDSVSNAVDAYYKADTGKTSVDVKDPHYSEAKAQVAAQLETEIANTMAKANSNSDTEQIDGLDAVLNSLQPGQLGVSQALQDFLPSSNPPSTNGPALQHMEHPPAQSGGDELKKIGEAIGQVGQELERMTSLHSRMLD
ncbi:hypothetical protein [Trinickia acidisoli]|uniref:hypothetical protein n=1 Tax=Trinickia acidisoli TaxID=2767482 RepID=UPI001A8D0E9C|nr:hypothetical protein [Trinickia acidisoli]